MFDIADVPFSVVGEEEKRLYEAKIKERGSFQGYKPRQWFVRPFRLTLHNSMLSGHLQHIDNGVRDQLEAYNGTPYSQVHSDVTSTSPFRQSIRRSPIVRTQPPYALSSRR